MPTLETPWVLAGIDQVKAPPEAVKLLLVAVYLWKDAGAFFQVGAPDPDDTRI